jgi:DNA-binding HxlR family transcriptional regulator
LVDIPVSKYIEILSIILVEKKSINVLTHLTGYSYKPALTQKLKVLEEEKLVTRIKDPEHKQREFIGLTELGREIITFYRDIIKVKSSYHILNQKFSEYEDLARKPEKIRNNILKAKNWSHQDIENFNDFRTGIYFIKSEIVRRITDIIVNRYVAIFLEFDIKDIGRLIIKKIFEEFIDFMNNDLIEFKNNPALSQKKQNIEEFKKTILKSTIGNMYYHFPDIIYNEVKKLSIAYINLINPSTDTIKDLWEEENNIHDGDRSLKKSNNHFELGELLTELAKKGHPQSALSWLILSNISKDYKFNLEPDSKLIKDVYGSLLS